MEKIKTYWLQKFQDKAHRYDDHWWFRKQQLWDQRNVKVVRIKGQIFPYRTLSYNSSKSIEYFLYISFFTKQKNFFSIEEQVLPYRAVYKMGKLTYHEEIPRENNFMQEKEMISIERASQKKRSSFTYNRRAAVKYAERWWNSYHPDFKHFTVDCTNYVSQCLYAGGAPMRGAPHRKQGWWYEGEEWSFSWAVAHSLRWYLSGSTSGLQGIEVDSPEELEPGDVICYDFEGDGRWDHTTIVVAKDAYDMPLVNAHTVNSRHRYWSYEDSTAWTKKIAYKFYKIGEP